MGARTKGRCRITVDGREFVWYVHAEYELRITSMDKKFSVSYPYPYSADGRMRVSGQEFPGIEPDELRPVTIQAPDVDKYSLKVVVRNVIRWSMNPSHVIVRMGAQPRSGGAA
jgi:hypothetical protein